MKVLDIIKRKLDGITNLRDRRMWEIHSRYTGEGFQDIVVDIQDISGVFQDIGVLVQDINYMIQDIVGGIQDIGWVFQDIKCYRSRYY